MQDYDNWQAVLFHAARAKHLLTGLLAGCDCNAVLRDVGVIYDLAKERICEIVEQEAAVIEEQYQRGVAAASAWLADEILRREG
jgi:hypothetical protein